MLILPKIGKCYESGIKQHKIWKEKKLLLHCNTPSVILTEITSLNTVMEYNVNLGGVFFFLNTCRITANNSVKTVKLVSNYKLP